MSNYPDNMPSARKGWANFMCTNSDCGQRSWDVNGTYDLGEFFADNENDTFCPSCGQEGE